jgi:hypothetical protein
MAKPGHLLTAFMDTMKRTRSISPTDVKAMRKRVDMAATRGVKFICPDMPLLDRNTLMRFADLRPPYPVTVFEGPMVPGAVAIVIARDTGDSVELNFIAHTEPGTETVSGGTGGWFAGPLLFRIPYCENSMHDFGHVQVKALLRDQVDALDLDLGSNKPFIRFYASICHTLANNYVETEDTEPDAKENRVRRIKGKAPLFTYKTLVIGEPKPKIKTGKGGTHASPRSHLRRGHYRTGKNGNRYWVSAAFVNGAPGFVHKDYELKIGAQ